MKLVPDWRDCWRWFSMHAMGWSMALIATWLTLPNDMRAAVPPWMLLILVLIILFLGMVGRVVEQAPSQGTQP